MSHREENLRKGLQQKKTLMTGLLGLLSTTYGWQPTRSTLKKISAPSELAQRLKTIVRELSTTIGVRSSKSYENLVKAALYVKKTFGEIGYPVEEWVYAADGKEYKNIVAQIKVNSSSEYIVIGAHYDSYDVIHPTPGADDNASGIAGVMELARLLKNQPLKTNLMFVAFVNEEDPFSQTDQMGSRVFVKTLLEKKLIVKSAIVLEMIGFYSEEPFSQRYQPLLGPFFPNRGNFIAVVGNFASKALVKFIDHEFKKRNHFPIQSLVAPGFLTGVSFSDHSSFWLKNIPAVMMTDTAYYRNTHYHCSTDTVDKLNFDNMAILVQELKESLVNLANQKLKF